jgi:pyrroline-5-carboxylate reductase
MTISLGVIGGGNMAQAIIAGIQRSQSGLVRTMVAEPHPETRTMLSNLGIHTVASASEVMPTSDFLMLAVKPQVMSSVCQDIAADLRSDQRIISIAAGITIASIRRALGDVTNPIIRVMPNTPVCVGEGMSALATDQPIEAADRRVASELFDACGRTVWLDNEDMIDSVTAISGSGPAYFFLMIESMVRSAIRLGVPPETARTLVTQTAKGASAMVETSDVGPDVLRQRVTSPGGTTAAALKVFEDDDYGDLIDRAMIAARNQAGALSKDA